MLGGKKEGGIFLGQEPVQARGSLSTGFEYVQLSPQKEQEISDGFHAIREGLFAHARKIERFSSDNLRFTI